MAQQHPHRTVLCDLPDSCLLQVFKHLCPLPDKFSVGACCWVSIMQLTHATSEWLGRESCILAAVAAA
jgi:hypothetical protein